MGAGANGVSGGMGNGLPEGFDADFDGVADAMTLGTLSVVSGVFL